MLLDGNRQDRTGLTVKRRRRHVTVGQYALLALLDLAAHYPQGEPRQIRQIASQQDIPDRYLEQLLATLKRSGLVRSQRGAKGGYLLAKEPDQITLLDVVVCLEG